MKHFILLYWIISFSVGFTTLIGVLLVYFRRRLQALRFYLLIMACLSTMVVISGIKVYADINLIGLATGAVDVLDGLSLAAEVPLVILCPLFILSFFNPAPFRRAGIAGFSALASFNAALTMTVFLFFRGALAVTNGILIGSIILSSLFCILYLVYNWKRLTDRNLRAYCIALMLMGGLCLTGLAFDLLFHLREKLSNVSGAFRVGVAVYLLMNLITLYFALRRFSQMQADGRQKLDAFCSSFGLTAQERRIVPLIMDGLSNAEIGERLFISTGTVKRHVYNIFHKTRAKSRLDLLRLIRET
jgi:DNA-binding CsgD family transcriptional regulator